MEVMLVGIKIIAVVFACVNIISLLFDLHLDQHNQDVSSELYSLRRDLDIAQWKIDHLQDKQKLLGESIDELKTIAETDAETIKPAVKPDGHCCEQVRADFWANDEIYYSVFNTSLLDKVDDQTVNFLANGDPNTVRAYLAACHKDRERRNAYR